MSALSAIGLFGGCSLLFHADASQCSSNADCTNRGPAFANHTCSAGTCVSSSAIMGGDAGSDATADARLDSSIEAADTGVDTGPAPDAGCHTTSDCVGTTTHPETFCDLSSGTGTCLQLTTDECPLVIPTDYATSPILPLFIGAFATIPPNAPTSHPSYLNYQLAINEFKTAGGIPAWDPIRHTTGLRLPVAIVCNADGNADDAMAQYASLNVPGVVAALDSVTLKTTFVNDALPNNIFFVNPFGADSTLTSLQTQGLLWHMLGQPSDNAPAYQAFLPRIEAYVRSASGQNLGSSTPMRVAVVTGNATVTQDLASAVLPVLSYNGMTVAQNSPANFLNEVIGSTLNPGVDLQSINLSKAISDLLAFQPNVIVSFASAEFVQLLQTLEIELAADASSVKPFYLLGPYNMDSQALLTWIGVGAQPGSATENKRMRLAGIGVASSPATSVLNSYETNFINANPNAPPSAVDQENYYDAIYFAIDSIVAAGSVSTLAGSNLGQGMLRLLSGTTYGMGPADMGNIFGALGSPNGTISLLGTLGPPDFTIRTGARIGEGDVYCFQRNTDLSAGFDYDVLRLNPAPTDGGAPTLGGTFPCYGGI